MATGALPGLTALRRHWIPATLVAVLALSGFLRFQGFADKGIFDSDAALWPT